LSDQDDYARCKACPNSIINLAGDQCVESCPTGQLKSFQGKRCVKSCGEGYIPNPDNTQCVRA
jgi:hypothetical protein